MTQKVFTAKGKVDYIVKTDGKVSLEGSEFYHDDFKTAFSRMFPNFKILETSEKKIEAHSAMYNHYFEIIATNVLV